VEADTVADAMDRFVFDSSWLAMFLRRVKG
jgi:hypothetical protein